MQIERAVSGIETLGPGKRFTVWVNGCPRSCAGCVSERLQKPCPDNETDVTSFLSSFEFSETDGVTISGGEPFLQADGLDEMTGYFQGLGITDILIYTGYTLEQLREMRDKMVDSILSKTAVLIDGPYIAELDTGRGNLKGSDNQRVIYLKPEFKPIYEKFYSEKRIMQEMRLGNILLAAGIPDKKYIEEFKNVK